MNESDLERRLLEYVSDTNYQPVKPRIIAKKLKLSDEETRELKKTIKRLVKRGNLNWGSKHLVQLGKRDDRNRLTGIFHRTQKGFGFVRPHGAPADRSADIFVPQKSTMDAASGDLVLIRLNKQRGPENRIRGTIVEVIERETNQFVGTYFESEGVGRVRVDNGVFGQPILVGDPGAKNAQPNDKVVIEMVRFPSHLHDGEAVIDEVLGTHGQPGVDTLLIMREYNLPDDFSEEVLEDARKQAEIFDESISENRVDLTDLPIITIDPSDARDFDDAISLEQLDNGHWRLGVHIADVSHFVQPQSALDREARQRATSVYLPDRVIPMLPEIISNNLASLQPDRIRYTKTVWIEFTADGAMVATDTCSAAIRSNRRFTYTEVDQLLVDRESWKTQLSPAVFQLVTNMHELAMILRKRRFRRGSLELSMPEVAIDLDRAGQVSGAHLIEQTESHQIIEEFMLAANEAVAKRVHQRGLLLLRRIHGAPDPRKLKILTDFVRGLQIPCDSLESRFEMQRVLKHVAGLPQQRAINFAILRSLQKAMYSPRDEGHYALASDCYCHFTSPIRRYPDLIVHRIIESINSDKQPTQDFDRLMVEGEHCSDREQRAEQAERELTKLKLLYYLSKRIGDELDAVITGVEDYGLFAQGIELPADGLIHVNSLQDDTYRFERATHTLTGFRNGNSYRLGDLVRVKIQRVDLDARELDYRIVVRKNESRTHSTNHQRRSNDVPGKSRAGRKKTKSRRGINKPNKSGKRGRRKKKS